MRGCYDLTEKPTVEGLLKYSSSFPRGAVNENAPALTHLPLPVTNSDHALKRYSVGPEPRPLCMKSVGPMVKPLERRQTDGRTDGQTGPRTLPLPLLREVMMTATGVFEYHWGCICTTQENCHTWCTFLPDIEPTRGSRRLGGIGLPSGLPSPN